MGAGTSPPILVNPILTYSVAPRNPTPSWSLGLVVTFSTGANLTANVLVTCDPQPNPSGNWNNHDTLFNMSGSSNGNVSFPITGLMLQVPTYSSGKVTLAVATFP
jgi:hypothetical protein